VLVAVAAAWGGQEFSHCLGIRRVLLAALAAKARTALFRKPGPAW